LKVKIDLHVHSTFSDGIHDVYSLLKAAKSKGLDGIAITDHNTIAGSIEAVKIARRMDDFIVVPGTEVRSKRGDILALGIYEDIRPDIEPEEVVDEIHERGGLAIAAHPYSRLSRDSLGDYVLKVNFDGVETLNARARGFENRKAEVKCKTLGLSCVGGSDAHSIWEVGNAYTVIEANCDINDILKGISMGLTKPVGVITPLGLILKVTLYHKLRVLGFD